MELVRQELDARRKRFIEKMDETYPEWDTALICSKVNQYYFMGTLQDAILLIRRNGEFAYYVRRSLERAKTESPLKETVFGMQSYRDAAAGFGSELGNVYMELDTVPYSMVCRMQKYFNIRSVESLEYAAEMTRAVKSPYELAYMERAGAQVDRLMLEEVPALLREGMTEAEFSGRLLDAMIRYGHQGITRFHIFQTEMVGGQYGFGANSVYPSSFDGPGGMHGSGAATPVTGDPGKKLEKGDMVFVDLGFGINGYHSDKTQVYRFGTQPTSEMTYMHGKCMEIQKRAADELRPGAIPSEIYRNALEGLPADFAEHFMGYDGQQVKFLGHGVGLYVDELPVITKGWDKPLEENMTIALEPKRGITGVGMVGVEDTFVVTKQGGRCITGAGKEIIVV